MKTVLGKKVKKGKYYKLMLVAYDKNGKKLAGSKIIHVVTKGGKYTNYKTATTAAKKNKGTLKKGKNQPERKGRKDQQEAEGTGAQRHHARTV